MSDGILCPVLLFSKLINTFLGNFDPKSIFFITKTNGGNMTYVSPKTKAMLVPSVYVRYEVSSG